MPALLDVKQGADVEGCVELPLALVALDNIAGVGSHVDGRLLHDGAGDVGLLFLGERILEAVLQFLAADVDFGDDELSEEACTLISMGLSFSESLRVLRSSKPSYLGHFRMCALNSNSLTSSRHPEHFSEFSGSILRYN